MSSDISVHQWLEEKYKEWITSQEGRPTLQQFSVYLNVDYKSLNQWINGNFKPSNDNVIKLANKLGWEIYDILEWERPTKLK